MKRIWIAIVFLAISIGICVSEQVYIEQTYKTIGEYCDNGNATELVEYWKDKNDMLYAFSDHKVLDNLSESIYEIEDAPDKQKALNKVKAITKTYYENQRITFSNIF